MHVLYHTAFTGYNRKYKGLGGGEQCSEPRQRRAISAIPVLIVRTKPGQSQDKAEQSQKRKLLWHSTLATAQRMQTEGELPEKSTLDASKWYSLGSKKPKKILVAIFAQIFNLCTINGILYQRKGRIKKYMEDFRRFSAKITQIIEHKFDFCAKIHLKI